MDAGKHSPAQVPQIENLSRIQASEIEPQQVATKFVDIDKWVEEQDAADQAAAEAETAARAAEKDSKNVTSVSSQVDDEKYVNSPATNSPAPTTAAGSSAPSEVMTGPAAAILLGDINWVGKLHEYRAVKPSPVPLSFVESTHSFGFTCTVVLPESSNHFGGPEKRFLRKKDAKQNAAKEAVTWLAENGHINANYSVRKTGPPTEASSISAPSSIPGGAALRGSTTTTSGNSPSFAQMIPVLCGQLGFSPPTYMLTLAPGATAIYSGYAHFPGDPRIVGHVGEFTNVYGKKNAKEVCAKEVFNFLKGIERQRAEQYQEATTGKRKRSDDVLLGNSRDWEDTRSIKTLVQENNQES